MNVWKRRRPIRGLNVTAIERSYVSYETSVQSPPNNAPEGDGMTVASFRYRSGQLQSTALQLGR